MLSRLDLVMPAREPDLTNSLGCCPHPAVLACARLHGLQLGWSRPKRIHDLIHDGLVKNLPGAVKLCLGGRLSHMAHRCGARSVDCLKTLLQSRCQFVAQTRLGFVGLPKHVQVHADACKIC